MDIKNSLEMLKDLSNAYGTSGFEDDVLKVGRKYGEKYCDIKEDSLRNLYFYRKNNTHNKPVIMIDGHSDELGFIVQAINPNGTLAFLELGRWITGALLGHKVKVRNFEGEYITGVIGAKPPHFWSEVEKLAGKNLEQPFIDIGSSSLEESVNLFKIEVGAPVVPDVSFEFMEQKNLMMGKGFDCRLGCGAVIDTICQLDALDLDVDIVGTFSSQEEVGTRGAKVSARTVKPDLAIVFEGSPSDDTFAPPHMIQAKVGSGSQIRLFDVMMISNPRLAKFAKDIAKEKNIDFQAAVRKGGGTNGGVIHLTEQGIPVLVLSVPVRYAHSHHGISSVQDYISTVKWAVEIIKRLNVDVIKSF